MSTPQPTREPGTDVVVGVALPVPEPWGGHLQRLRTGYGEDHAQHIPTHITLLPPTPVPESVLEALTGHLSRVAASHPPFEVLLRGTGTFRPVSDVVFVQVAKGVAGCERLERAVRSGPVVRELEFPYHPHVTLAHGLAEPVLDRAFLDLAAFSCGWPATGFRLYAHDGDGLWRTVADYPLTG
ncbi:MULTISPECIES: 2'-5' RNA ligase family protein [unclassified Serinicoccus]|uniref:2'-5' RNA ligase family protein n=1 Tax=unclassified Serinicoccus TaxID=2643101 RepID=UPI003853F873